MFPWYGKELICSPYDGEKIDFYSLLLSVQGVFAGESLDPFIPSRWSRSNWEYVALLMGANQEKYFDREFIGRSSSVGKDRRGARGGPLVLRFDLSTLAPGSMVEIRSGGKRGADRYQRVYRLDRSGWFHVAFRQEDVRGWDPVWKRYKVRRFYQWMVIEGVKED